VIKLINLLLLLTFTVSTVKAQNPNDPNAGRQTPTNSVNIGVAQDPYFKEYLGINRKTKEDKKFSKFYNRKMIVVLAEEDPQKLKFYKSSPQKLEFYKELIRSNNELLTHLVPQYWKQISSDQKNADTILFRKYSECLALSKTNPKEYVTLEFSSLRDSYNENLFELVNKPGVDYRKALLIKEGEFGKMEIKLLEEFEKPAIYNFYTITSYPNELDFTIAIQQMGNFFIERYEFMNRSELFEQETASRREALKTKILLVDTFQVEKRNGFGYIQEKFPATHGLTNGDGMLQIIKSKDTSYAYVVVVPYFPVLGDKSYEYTSGGTQEGLDKISYFHLLINSENTEILSYIRNDARIINKKSWSRYANSFELDNSTLK
jgi:hypothetical protein